LPSGVRIASTITAVVTMIPPIKYSPKCSK